MFQTETENGFFENRTKKVSDTFCPNIVSLFWGVCLSYDLEDKSRP